MKEVILSFHFKEGRDVEDIDREVKEVARKLFLDLAHLGLESIHMRAAGHSRVIIIMDNLDL